MSEQNEDLKFLAELLKQAEQSKGLVELVRALHRSGIPLQRMSFAKSRMTPIYEVLRRCAENKHVTWREYENICWARGWNPDNAKRLLEAIAEEGKFVKLEEHGIHWVEEKEWFWKKKGE